MTRYIIKVEADPSSDKIWVILSTGNIKSQETAIAKEGDTIIDFENKPEEILIRRETSLLRTFSKWYCRYVTATSPDENTYYFPIFRNISAGLTTIKEKSGKLPCEDLSEEREKDLKDRNNYLVTLGWRQLEQTALSGEVPTEKPKEHNFLLGTSFLVKALSFSLKLFIVFRDETPLDTKIVNGLPRFTEAGSIFKLPSELWFDAPKLLTLIYYLVIIKIQRNVRQFWNMGHRWRTIEDIRRVFLFPSKKAEYISKNWKDDAFFGSQFLNGCNPLLIKKYTEDKQKIPIKKLKMFYPDIEASIMEGIIYVVDYELLDGIRENVISGHQQFLAAPIVLLKEEDNTLMPIAIQLTQKPADDEPIYTPCDGNAWLLAKIWVRNADFYIHELSSHLLQTHLVGEALFIAIYTSMSRKHPLLRLVSESGRFTLPINVIARNILVNEGGFFTQNTGLGKGAQLEILKRAFKQLTYQSLCLPDDLKNRGVENLSNYYYKQDGLMIWAAINKFCDAVVNNYYRNDSDIKNDYELQRFIKQLYQNGLSKCKGGWPNTLETREDTAKFLTTIMFTCSALHAAVNNGQYDTYAWMPNGPTTMRQPPPKLKEDVTEEYIMNTLPDINVTLESMSVAHFLSQPPSRNLLGQYSDEVKHEPKMKGPIEEFNEVLKKIEDYIDRRSKTQELPYEYLSPSSIENSITI
ncbi:polyunsaturated fatty acid 5-lipoxygenase-like [Lepisosteus oculatus]|uniref:Arachidonate 8S-lipoxygenase-like n=1 Tax=Lepisosteus oculatus TaxID=7918 RepID=W5MRU8_LEPOC|nr:PREDICTED: arachidonate 8S-lipoxygenase-like [Lepisosteus oculatus]